jgi:Ferritin-like
MIHLQWKPIASVDDAISMLQTAAGIELGTLPPYLYALYSIPPGANAAAAGRIKSIALQEMIHMCLACNILNALGGDPVLTPPVYPGPLPGDIGPPGGEPLTVHVLPFSEAAMQQGMNIEAPEHPMEFPIETLMAVEAPQAVTIGQFYQALDRFLSTLPPDAWQKGRHQIDDAQFFAGQLFAINGYADAHQAIDDIVSEGEGAPDSPLDFQHEIAHYYRFGECRYNKVLTKADNDKGYTWGPASLGIVWSAVYPAIPDPGTHDFSGDPPAAQEAQAACNEAFTRMIDELRLAVTGHDGRLGNAVRAMFDLRMAAHVAFTTPLAGGREVAGPSFVYTGGKR